MIEQMLVGTSTTDDGDTDAAAAHLGGAGAVLAVPMRLGTTPTTLLAFCNLNLDLVLCPVAMLQCVNLPLFRSVCALLGGVFAAVLIGIVAPRWGVAETAVSHLSCFPPSFWPSLGPSLPQRCRSP